MAASEVLNSVWYYSVTFSQGSLGVSLIGRDPARRDCPLLGNTLVDGLQSSSGGYPGQAERGGVKVGDFLVSLNNEYVAFSDNAAVVDMIMNFPRPLVVQFCRPLRNAWQKLLASESACIRTGTLHKPAGWLGKLQPRYCKLSRSTFSYYSAGTLKKRLSMRDILGTKNNGSEGENSFVVTSSEKDINFVAETPMDKILWLHAVDCARKHTFDTLPPGPVSSPAALVRNKSQGRMAGNKYSSGGGAISNSSSNGEWSRKFVLSHCRVAVSVGAKGAASGATPGTTTSIPTANVIDDDLKKYFDYDFSLERKVIAAKAGDLD